MIIAHVSDIHVGPDFVRNAFQQAVREILHLRPDLIVVTGDLTENGALREYQEAARLLRAFKDFPMLVVPGNHDYRLTGYLLYKELFGSPQKTELGNAVFLSVSTARPDRDEGEVGHRQNVWLEQSLRRNPHRMKIVVMHHHVVQVPDTGTDRITILDAGDVLKVLLLGPANLVLCGHRHRPWMWNLSGVQLVHAGTMSSTKTRGFFANTYNILDVPDSGEGVKVWLKMIGGKRLDMGRIVKARRPYLPRLALALRR
jgi:3',5'-cyclic AMP phosphodiesterase CpdA